MHLSQVPIAIFRMVEIPKPEERYTYRPFKFEVSPFLYSGDRNQTMSSRTAALGHLSWIAIEDTTVFINAFIIKK